MTQVLIHTPGTHELGRAAVAIGVFDGVHRGHQALIADAVNHARAVGEVSCVLTFDRDPESVVCPDRAAAQLTAYEDRIRLIADLGPDYIMVIPFTPQIASLSPERFCTDVLLDAMTPTTIYVGYDFRFGARAAGTAYTMVELGVRHGFRVHEHPLLNLEGAPVTSTRIRQAIAEGEVALAARLLSRPHRLHGTVVQGKMLGRTIGFPTANLAVEPGFAMPATGGYAGWVTVGGKRYMTAMSVGEPPMFPGATWSLEAHLLDFEGDIYGEPALVEFVEWLYPLVKWDSLEQLIAVITEYVARAREILGAG